MAIKTYVLIVIRLGGIAARNSPIGRKAVSAFRKSLKLSLKKNIEVAESFRYKNLPVIIYGRWIVVRCFLRNTVCVISFNLRFFVSHRFSWFWGFWVYSQALKWNRKLKKTPKRITKFLYFLLNIPLWKPKKGDNLSRTASCCE